MEKVQGSMGALSAMQITADTHGLDIQTKTILQYAEVLAVILKGTVPEYGGHTLQEIMGFIEAESITSTTEVSPGRTNTEIRGENSEFFHLNEKTTRFDLAFRARNPLLSTEDIQINLHFDVEPQKTYTPGYPIEKRGIYYLARRLSSQLSLVLDETDYSQLAKCYSIWICRDEILPEERYSISFYEMANTKNTVPNSVAKENYDLMTLVVIKLGDEVYNGGREDEGYDLLRFLNAIMYPHKDDFMATVTEYMDYSENEELWKEVTHVSSLEQVIFEGAVDDAKKLVAKEMKKAREELDMAWKRLYVAREKVYVENKKAYEERGEPYAERDEAYVERDEAYEARDEAYEARDEAYEARDEAYAALEKGIQAIIQDNLNEKVPKERILLKLQKLFGFTEEKSEQYYKKYSLL